MRRNTTLLILISLLSVLLLSSCGSLSASDSELTEPLDNFLKSASAGDIDVAWQWSSEEAKAALTKESLEKAVNDQPYLFKHYESLSIKNKRISVVSGEDPIADVEGEVKYTDNDQGTFTARLQKQGADWRVSGINITVSPDRIKKYISDN